jgi:hypothetical protein
MLSKTELLRREYKIASEVAEVGLKYISWTILLAAIDVARTKSGNAVFLIGEIIVGGLLWVYLYGQIMMRIDINIVPVEKLGQRRYFVLAVAIQAAIIGMFLFSATTLSIHVVKALVDVQLPKEATIPLGQK